MKIYTKTGDKGETGLFGGERVPKDSLRIETYGTVDELNAVLGVVRSLKPHIKIEKILSKLQNELFILGSDLATPVANQNRIIPRIKNSHAIGLEKIIDRLEMELEPLKTFILPGGSPSAAQLHFARTVCRRTERLAVQLSRHETIGDAIGVYLNRLSDLLFVLARYANFAEHHAEIKWIGRRKSIKSRK